MPFSFQVPYTQGNDASAFNEGMQSAGGMVAQAIQNQLRNQQIQQAKIQNQYLPYSEQADIGAKLMQTQLMPMQTTAALYRGMGSYGGALNNYIANLQRYAQTPEGKQFLAQNPQAMKNYLSTLSNLSQNAPSAAGMGPAAINGVPSVNVGNVFGGLPPSLFPLLRPTNAQGSSSQQSYTVPANNSGSSLSTPSTPTENNQNNVVAQNSALNPPVNMQQLPMSNAQIQTLKTLESSPSPTPQNVQSAQDVSASDVIAKTVPKDIQKQRYYAQSVDNMLNQVAPIMPKISQFAGIVGKTGLTVDKYGSAFNLKNDPNYQTYNNFIHTQAPLISNEMRRAFGGQATDTEMKTMGNLANPIYWNSNPQLALSQFNSLVNTLRANDKALTQSQSQTLGGLNNAINNPPYAKTTNSLGNALGGGQGQTATVKIPNFSTKEQGVAWFNSQPPQVQAQIRAQLRGG